MGKAFGNGAGSLGAPALNAFAVTPSDGADLAQPARALYAGEGGDVRVTTYNGDVVTFVGLAAGVVHPITAVRVWATGTDAASIVALY